MPSRTKKQNQELLTVPEVAEICGISPESVRRLTDRGAMPRPVRLGRSVRYRRTEIKGWIAEGCEDLSKRR